MVEGEKSRRLNIRNTTPTEKKCFVCDIKLYCDNHIFNKGSLRRCEQQQSKDKLLQAVVPKLKHESDKYYQAACRFDILASGNTFRDIFVVDSCTHTSLENLSLNNQEVEDKLIDFFLRKIELRILKDKKTFLLTELLLDLKEMSYEFGLDSPASRLTHTYQLKKMLLSCLGVK